MPECVLCKYSGSKENETVHEVLQYISESAGRVHIREVSKQAREALNSELGLSLVDEDVEEHITTHTLDQRVVLSSILKDLVGIARTVKDCSVVQDAESGAQAVDTKALTAYLKTIDQITAIYKMESMRSLNK